MFDPCDGGEPEFLPPPLPDSGEGEGGFGGEFGGHNDGGLSGGPGEFGDGPEGFDDGSGCLDDEPEGEFHGHFDTSSWDGEDE